MRFLESLNRNRPFIYFNSLLFFVLINALASGLQWDLDLSEDGMNSLTGSTEKVLSRLHEPVLVEAYISTGLPGEIVTMLEPVKSILHAIDREGGEMLTVRHIDPDTPEKMDEAEKRGIRGIPVEEARVDQISQKLAYFGLYVKMGDKSSVIPLVGDGGIIDDLEYRFLRELKKMMRENESSGIGFLHLPGSLGTKQWRSYDDQNKDNMYAFRALMEKDLGQVSDVELSEPVSSDVELLILAGLPDMTERQQGYLDDFILRGGKLLLFASGVDFQLQGGNPAYRRLGLGGQGGGYASVPGERLEKFNAWLSGYGVSVNGEILLEPELAAAAMDVQGNYIMPVPNPAWAVYGRGSGNIVAEISALESVEQVVFPWFSGLDIREASNPDVSYSVIVKSSPNAISRDFTSLSLRDLQDVGNSPREERVGRSLPLAVVAKGKFHPGKETKNSRASTESAIAVVGSSSIVSDIFFQSDSNRQIFAINQAFVLNLMESIYGDSDLAEARSRVRTLKVLDETDQAFEVFFTWFHILFIPFILAVYGTIRLLKRNVRRGEIGEGRVEE